MKNRGPGRTRLSRRTKIAGVGVIVVASAIMIAWRTGAPSTTNGPQTKTALSPAEEREAVREFRAGARYRYDYERRVTTRVRESETPLALRGKLDIDVMRADANGLDVAVSIHLTEPAVRDLEPALRLTFDANGAVTQLSRRAAPAASQADDAASLERLALDGASLVFFARRVIGADEKAPLEGWDTTGHFSTTLGAATVGDTQSREFHKTRYDVPPGSPLSLVLAKSNHELEWNAAAFVPLRVKGLDRIQAQLGKTEVAFADASYTLAFAGVSVSRLDEAALTDFQLYDLGQDGPGAALAELHTQPVDSESARQTFERGTRALAGVEAMSGSERLEVLADLVQGTKAAPERTRTLATTALSAAPGSPTQTLLAAAIAANGTPEAQASLRSMYSDAHNADTRVAAMNALVSLDGTPTKETMNFLASELSRGSTEEGEHGASVREAVGLAAGALYAVAPDGDVGNAIRDAVERAGSPEEKTMALGFVGNAGSGAFRDLSERAIADQDGAVRAEGVLSLRKLPDVDPKLGTFLNAEEDPRVQQAAAQALSLRDWSRSLEMQLTACFRARLTVPARILCGDSLLDKAPGGPPQFRAFVEQTLGDPDLPEAVRVHFTRRLSNASE